MTIDTISSTDNVDIAWFESEGQVVRHSGGYQLTLIISLLMKLKNE